MAHRMSRRDRFIIRLILGVAFATFLLAIWAFVGGGKSQSVTVSPATPMTNHRPSAAE